MSAVKGQPQRAAKAGPDQSDTTFDTTFDTTCDAFLGGRLMLHQPKKGHRAGHDAILLAAFCRARNGESAADFGAGIGAAGLALACRVNEVRVALIEREDSLVRLAQQNVAGNGLAARVSAICADVETCGAGQGIASGAFDHVIMNPPYNDPARHRASPDLDRAQAHMREKGTLALWIKAGKRLLKPKGEVALIWRADGLADVLAELDRGFGGIEILPVHPLREGAAIRVLVRASLGSRAPLAILPGLYLRERNGMGGDDAPGAEADRILRDGAVLMR